MTVSSHLRPVPPDDDFPVEPDALAPLRVIVVAAGQGQSPDDLAQRSGVSHACLIPLHGTPIIARLLAMLAHHPRVGSLAVVAERELFGALYDVLTRLPGRGTVKLCEPRGSFSQGIVAAAEGWDGPLIVIRCGHAMIDDATIDALADGLLHADAVMAFTPIGEVRRITPDASLRRLDLRDGSLADCALLGLRGRAGLEPVGRLLRDGGLGQDVRAFGWIGLLLLRTGWLTLPSAFAHLSRRIGLAIAPVMLADGRQAITVRDERSLALVNRLIEADAAQTPQLRPRAVA